MHIFLPTIFRQKYKIYSMKYLLSTGKTTTQPERYILDLFRLYLGIMPSDIPGAPNIGFNFNLSDVFKSDLPDEIRSRVSDLIRRIQARIKSGLSITLESCELISPTQARIVVGCGEIQGEEIIIEL